MITRPFFKKPGVWIGFALFVGLAALLALGWRGQGPVWNSLYGLTGEETLLAQAHGFVEYLGNFLRAQPRTEPMTPVNHADVSPYGVNTFLQLEVEVAKRERQLQMIAEAGFKMIRQQFPWEDIEIHGRGDFIDRRNDPNGVDAWAKYDNIVELSEQYGIEIQARLDNPPAWTHANPDIGEKAPPDDLQDFVNYAVAVAERYKGRIHYYQIWNEPNIYPEWGNQPVNPEAYTDLLCRVYPALKAVDAQIVVISGPLSPTVSLSAENLSDLIFLQRMYDAGAGACFDVMSAQGYGFYSGPTDRRLRPLTLTYARHLYIRDLMVANGDAHKSLWISEAAWNPQPEDPTLVTSQYGNFGIVTEEQAARYMPQAYQRAQEEWPWIGNIAYWFFKLEDDSRRNQAFYYFRMVEPDFTPLPVYDSMKRYITTQTPVLYPGVHQAEDWRIQYQAGKVKIRPLPDRVPGAEFDTSIRYWWASFAAHGTLVSVRWQGESALEIRKLPDRNPIAALPEGEGWQTTILHQSLLPETVSIDIQAEDNILIDSITVIDRTYQNVAPLAAGVLIVVGMTLFVVVRALRERRR